MKSIKVDSELWKRAQEYAQKAGYSSIEEFVQHLLEKELSRADASAGAEADRDEVERRLKGLGYLE